MLWAADPTHFVRLSTYEWKRGSAARTTGGETHPLKARLPAEWTTEPRTRTPRPSPRQYSLVAVFYLTLALVTAGTCLPICPEKVTIYTFTISRFVNKRYKKLVSI